MMKSSSYTYDANGNMTRDRNKGIHSISYNILNLPSEVVFDDGHVTRYTYTADGRKLKVEYQLNNVRFDEPIVRPISPISGYSGISPIAFGGEAPKLDKRGGSFYLVLSNKSAFYRNLEVEILHFIGIYLS